MPLIRAYTRYERLTKDDVRQAVADFLLKHRRIDPEEVIVTTTVDEDEIQVSLRITKVSA